MSKIFSKIKEYILNKKMGLIMLLFFYMLLKPSMAVAFSDVPENSWASKDIKILSSKRILSGYSNQSFKPKNNISRAEFATLIIKALGMEKSAEAISNAPQLFWDVPKKHWAIGAIQLTWELGIAGGYIDNSFKPDQPIKRDEMVSMLVRALKLENSENNQPQFSDHKKISSWAISNVYVAANWNLTSGYPDGSFRGGNNVTREQAAVFISKVLDLRGTKYDYYGKIEKINPLNNKINILLNDNQEEFTLDPKVIIVNQDKTININQLTKVKDKHAFLILNDYGQVIYLEIINSSIIQNIQLKFELSRANLGSNSLLKENDSLNKPMIFDEDLIDEQNNKVLKNTDISKSIDVTKNAMGINRFNNYTGKKKVVAVIDSGIDPGHEALQKTSTGKSKVIDFLDLTDDGKVVTDKAINANNRFISIEDRSFELGNIISKSGTIFVGFLKETEKKIDFNGDGKLDQEFLVVLADSKKNGVYDTVYIDTNSDYSLKDEIPLKCYKEQSQIGNFRNDDENRNFNFLVSHIDDSGRYVKLGFDSKGHGTKVAGILAGNSSTFTGVAPDVELLVIKVVNNSGETEWNILEEAIKLAATKNVDIVNLSLGYYNDITSGNNSLSSLIDRYSKSQNMIFVVASGNKGPGLGTISTPSNANKAIGVGAYISPAMWEQDYEWKVSKESILNFSSIGPRQDGLLTPTIVAPGSVVTTVPAFTGNKYELAQGTSIAAPHVAGLVALLLERASTENVVYSSDSIKRALMEGARKIDDYSYVECGYGLVNINSAWQFLHKIDLNYYLKSYTWNKQLGIGEGIYAKDFLPGSIIFKVGNLTNSFENVYWKSDSSWLRPWFKVTSIPVGGQREIPVDYVLPSKPGLYTGLLKGSFLNSSVPEVSLLTTIVKPYLLTQENNYYQEFTNSLFPARNHRYYFHVPKNTKKLETILDVPSNGKTSLGRVRMHLIAPNGEEYVLSEYVGVGNLNNKVYVKENVSDPQEGNWELVVYSSPALSKYGLYNSMYNLKVQLNGAPKEEIKVDNKKYIVGVIPKTLVIGKVNYISVSVRDAKTKKPIKDMMIEINGLLYHVKNGWTTIRIVPDDSKLNLSVIYS